MLKKSEKFSLPEIEEKVLKFWRENQIFEKSLKKNAKKKKFVFYEGPPTANGRPGIHHVLSRSFKDIIPRYKTMRGFFVPRQAGWDTHGLPVELEVEKALGLKSKKEIEKYGIAAFNQKCKESVWKYKDEWEKLTERIGFWLDLKDPYITYQNSYIDKLWGIIKQITDKKLLYKGYKVVPWCTRCGTALSSHEMALGYESVEEQSVYVKFRLVNKSNRTYVLSWTTTPWTLPGNVALAVNPKTLYVKIKVGQEFYILAKERLSVISEPYEVVKEMKGKELVGLKYEPLFNVKKFRSDKSYRIYPAGFVTTEEGTGVVHTAVMYGEDDYELGKKIGLPQHHTVDELGKFTKEVPDLAGLYVKDKKTEEKIIQHLKTHNSLLKTELYSHDYPFCWRCSTPLLYYARSSWFVAMSKLRKKLLLENDKINWIPEHLKHGRFGEWLKEVKDWNFSRERYWGTPLPIWQCEHCGHQNVIGRIAELAEVLGKARNQYLLMRHGEAQNNLKEVINFWPESQRYNLTLKGVSQIENQAKKLKKEKIDFIFSSDLTRTKETAKILGQRLDVKVVYDKRLREINLGALQGRKNSEYHAHFSSDLEKFTKPIPEGETLRQVARRVFYFISDLEKKYSGRKFLIVSHEYPLWMLETVMRDWGEEETVAEKKRRGKDFIKTGEVIRVDFLRGPRNENGFMDLHRPYLDAVVFKCSRCRGRMERVKEIADVWFDSGSMPFASNPAGYPADYISEGIDQTRGWFYTLLAVGVLMGKGRSYKNVYVQGILLDKFGKKMSKSKGNVVDPWAMIEKYGIDAVRWFIYTGTRPGESASFDEAEIGKTLRQFIMLVYNSFVFYETYAYKSANRKSQIANSGNVLDKWILARLNETVAEATKDLDKYDIGGAAKAVGDLADDLSRWYIRRSRRRLQKPESQKDYEAASQTLGYVLLNLSKLLAPFTPFFAEALYKSYWSNTSNMTNEPSVHLEDWPKTDKRLIDKKLLKAMEEIRYLASLALAKRAEAGVKVRQPLPALKINKKFDRNLLEVLGDEVNVKKVTVDSQMKTQLELDTTITHKLKEEGWLREFIRLVQDLRQDAGLEPKEGVILMVEPPAELNYVIQKNEKVLKREVNAKTIEYKRSAKFDAELETKLDEWPIWLGLRKPL